MAELGADFATRIQKNTYRYIDLFMKSIDMLLPLSNPHVGRCFVFDLLGYGNFLRPSCCHARTSTFEIAGQGAGSIHPASNTHASPTGKRAGYFVYAAKATHSAIPHAPIVCNRVFLLVLLISSHPQRSKPFLFVKLNPSTWVPLFVFVEW